MGGRTRQDGRSARCLSARGHRQALPPLRAPALQDEASVLGAHADQEPVGAAAPPVVRLKRALHNVIRDEGRETGRLSRPASVKTSELPIVVSESACVNERDAGIAPSRARSELAVTGPERYGILSGPPVLPCRDSEMTRSVAGVPSQDFHNCGKNCGKPARPRRRSQAQAGFSPIRAWRKGLYGRFSGVHAHRAGARPAYTRPVAGESGRFWRVPG